MNNRASGPLESQAKREEISYHPFVVVPAEEVEQGFHALLVMEQLGGEVPVEELHPVANGLGERGAREGCIERLKVQLEDKVAVAAAEDEAETNQTQARAPEAYHGVQKKQ